MMIECIKRIRPTDPVSPDSRPLSDAQVPAIRQSPCVNRPSQYWIVYHADAELTVLGLS